MSLRLIIEDDEGATTIVPLEARAVTIGRQEGNTIQLTERNVSRRHARLAPAPEGWIIEDLNSYNGIRVNGIAIEGKVMLREGDVAQIGDYHLALCEDVDKKTLNLDRPVKAANDDEPLLVSSSSGLPKLTAAEVAELQQGYKADAATSAPTSAPRMTYPATSRRTPSQKGRIGVVVAAGGGVALVGLVVAFLVVRGGPGRDAAPQAQAPPPPPVQTPPAATPVQNPAPVPTPSPPTQAPGAAMDTQAAVDDLGVGDVQPVADEESSDEKVQARDSESDRSERSRSAAARRKAARRSKSSSSTPPPPPPPAPPTSGGSSAGVDATQLLKDARVASLKGSHELAYQLARKAYDAKRSPAALKVMGVAACKMGDTGKAKAAYRKLSGANKEGLAKVCEGQGIKL